MGLGKRSDFGDAKYAGLDVAFNSDIVETLEVRLFNVERPRSKLINLLDC